MPISLNSKLMANTTSRKSVTEVKISKYKKILSFHWLGNISNNIKISFKLQDETFFNFHSSTMQVNSSTLSKVTLVARAKPHTNCNNSKLKLHSRTPINTFSFKFS